MKNVHFKSCSSCLNSFNVTQPISLFLFLFNILSTYFISACKGTWFILPGNLPEWQWSNYTFGRYFTLYLFSTWYASNYVKGRSFLICFTVNYQLHFLVHSLVHYVITTHFEQVLLSGILLWCMIESTWRLVSWKLIVLRYGKYSALLALHQVCPQVQSERTQLRKPWPDCLLVDHNFLWCQVW